MFIYFSFIHGRWIAMTQYVMPICYSWKFNKMCLIPFCHSDFHSYNMKTSCITRLCPGKQLSITALANRSKCNNSISANRFCAIMTVLIYISIICSWFLSDSHVLDRTFLTFLLIFFNCEELNNFSSFFLFPENWAKIY